MNGLEVSSRKVFQRCFSEMLVPFSIDPEALCNEGLDLSAVVACHRRVIQEWRKHGILVHSEGALTNSALLNKIEKLPQECRKLWKAALTSTRRRPASVQWDGTFPENDLSEMNGLSTEFDLALLDPVRAQAICGLDAHQSSRIYETLSGMELCKFHAVSESNNFSRAEAIAKRPLAAGDNCGREWHARYSSYIKQAAHVTIVDRYICANHLHRLFKKELSGLTRLLTDALNRPRSRQVSIKLFCAVQNIGREISPDDQQAINDFIDNLSARYRGGGIGRMDVCILKDRDFSAYAHARYFRTDYSVFCIDRGIDSFGGFIALKDSLVWRDDTSASSVFSKQEAQLQAAAAQCIQII